jgi:hypothetical protein
VGAARKKTRPNFSTITAAPGFVNEGAHYKMQEGSAGKKKKQTLIIQGLLVRFKLRYA